MLVLDLASLTLSTVRKNLLQSIIDSWVDDLVVQEIIQQMQIQVGNHQGYNFIHQQLKRNGKLVVCSDHTLRTDSVWCLIDRTLIKYAIGCPYCISTTTMLIS